MEVIIFMIVLCFLFSSQKKKSQKVGKKETPVQNRPVTDYRPQTQSRPVNSILQYAGKSRSVLSDSVLLEKIIQKKI